MNSTANSNLRPTTSPPTELPSSKKTKASRSASAACATTFVPIPSTVSLGDGRVIQLALKPGVMVDPGLLGDVRQGQLYLEM